jgi:DNA-binding SARP family transcriptional activator
MSSAAIQNSLGIILSKAGGKRLLDAIDCFTRASKIVKRFPENRGLEASITNNWAMTERKAGNLQAAYKKSIGAVDLLKREEDFSPHFGSIFYNAVRLSLYLGKLEKALAILELGLTHVEKYTDQCSLALIWRGYAIYHEQLGDLNMAKEYLTKALPVFEDLRLKRMIILVNRDLCRVNTDLELLAEAEQNLSAAWDAKKTRDDADAVSILITEAKLRIAQEKLHIAERLLSYALKLSRKYGLDFERFLILVEMARVAHTKARHIEVESTLRKIARLSSEKSYDYMLSRKINTNRWMIDILIRSEKQYTLSVLKRWKVSYHFVETHLFGTPQIIVDGQRIKASAWKTSKALKLSCYLCHNHGKMISRDILINTLWKETSPRAGAKNLRKAVHHVRQAFESVIPARDNPIVYKGKKYKLSADFSVWVDTEAFETLTQHAKKARRRPGECKEHLLQAIRLYQDGLAKGWYDDWIEDIRGYYGKKFEECLSLMIDIRYRKKDYREALSWCRKLVVHDNLDEQYHMKMWSILAKLKKFNGIKKDFRDLKQILRKELRTAPRPKTVEFYTRLVK